MIYFSKENHLFILHLQSDYYNTFVYISVSSSRFSPAGVVIVDGAHQNANGVTKSFLSKTRSNCKINFECDNIVNTAANNLLLPIKNKSFKKVYRTRVKGIERHQVCLTFLRPIIDCSGMQPRAVNDK